MKQSNKSTNNVSRAIQKSRPNEKLHFKDNEGSIKVWHVQSHFLTLTEIYAHYQQVDCLHIFSFLKSPLSIIWVISLLVGLIILLENVSCASLD